MLLAVYFLSNNSSSYSLSQFNLGAPGTILFTTSMKIRSLRFILVLLLAPLVIATKVRAQEVRDTSWKHQLIAAVNLSQVSYSHWQAGGSNSLAYLASINGQSVHDVPQTNWTTGYKLVYGQAKLGDQGIRKTDDEINLESVLTYKLGVHINPYGALSFITQFAPGYQFTDTSQTQVSDFLDPAYIKQSVGVGFKFSDYFQQRLGVALREIVTNHFNFFSDDPETPEVEHTKIEGGFEAVSELALPIEDNVLLTSKVALFSPIKHMGRISVHGEGALIGKISKYFSAQLTAQLINEPDISPYTQLKQGLSLGIVYSIF